MNRNSFLYNKSTFALFRVLINVIVLFLSIIMQADAKDFFEISEEMLVQCQGAFKNKKPTEQELKEIFKKHEEWYQTYDLSDIRRQKAQSDSRRANLCGANLENAYLEDINLDYADLSGAILVEQDLSNTRLDHTNLKGTHMGLVSLTNNKLIGTNLIGAFLGSADLCGVKFIDTKLSYAYMGNGADLRGAVFEPIDLPDISGIADAQNLSQMTFNEDSKALFSLCKAFKEAGYHRQEREIIYAIKRSEMLKLLEQKSLWSRIEGLFNFILFDFTTHWGLAPGRALRILIVFIPIFASIYAIRLNRRGTDGIWLVWSEKSIRTDLGTKKPIKLHLEWRQAIMVGFYFSLLSAFSIGWREINVGYWIQRLQIQDNTLQATGWVRTISGFQSLMSVYLLAIWALTYFGQPFQ